MKNFFDRKTFNPYENRIDQSTLKVLRRIGLKRMELAIKGETGKQAQSTGLKYALSKDIKSGTFVDLGCGDSGDCLVMRNLGYFVSGFDLFPPREFPEVDQSYFVAADVVESIPLLENDTDIVLSQAMIDLIEPVARSGFFNEVNRILKPGGIFVCYLQWLQTGWGFDLQEEYDRAKEIWTDIEFKPTGFIATKTEKRNERFN